MIDDKDLKILSILQKNSRTSNAEIARQLGIATSAVFERIRKLETKKIIRSYEARLNPKELSQELLAFIFVRTSDPVGDLKTARLLAELASVQEVHHITGEDCYLLKVRASSTEDLGRIMREDIGKIKEVSTTRTTIALETVKETCELCLGAARGLVNR